MTATKRRKHIVGGVLMSAGLMIIGLAITVLTLENRMEDDEDE